MLAKHQQILRDKHDQLFYNQSLLRDRQQSCIRLSSQKPQNRWNIQMGKWWKPQNGKRWNLLWLPLMHTVEYPRSFKMKIFSIYKITYQVMQMMMFDLGIDFITAVKMFILYCNNMYGITKEFDELDLDEMSRREYLESFIKLKNVDNGFYKHVHIMLKESHTLHNLYDLDKLNMNLKSYATMRNIIQSSLRRDPIILKYKYDTPWAHQVHTFADNTIVTGGFVHIFECGKIITKVPFKYCCHSHGLKYYDPEWRKKCRHLQCVRCGILYNFYSDRFIKSHPKINTNYWQNIKEDISHRMDYHQIDKKIKQKCKFCDGYINSTKYYSISQYNTNSIYTAYSTDKYYTHEYDSDSSDDEILEWNTNREKIFAKMLIMKKIPDELVADETVFIRSQKIDVVNPGDDNDIDSDDEYNYYYV